MNGSASGSSNNLPAPQFSECVFLPKDTFCSLFNATNAIQNKNPMPIMPMYKSGEYISTYPEMSRMDYENRFNSPMYPLQWHPSLSGNEYRPYRGAKKRYIQVDSDDEMSFPGDPDYINKRKRRSKDDDRESIREKNEFKELVEAIGMLRHEISTLKQIRSQSPQKHSSILETMPTIEEKDALSPKPSILNASLTPEQEKNHSFPQDQSLLSINKRLFVNALNKIES
ncbi:capsid scaffold protein [macacine betaherpesvirus 9]|nr:capsid scaffold protein [macacine betaherpesvirus 9]ANC96582.1 capsid scaffold protein [macacine betaherpesvirus 9]